MSISLAYRRAAAEAGANTPHRATRHALLDYGRPLGTLCSCPNHDHTPKTLSVHFAAVPAVFECSPGHTSNPDTTAAMSPASAVFAAVCLALLAAAAAQPAGCDIPTVGGVDQSATSPADYGKCIKTQNYFGGSHWCKFGKLGTWPAAPEGKAKQCLKFGRSTIYRGPIYGSSSQHKAACNKVLRGNDNFAMVAVSTKYLKTHQGGWTADQGACHKCLCVRLHGGDDLFNKGLQKGLANQRIGLTFLAKVREGD